PLPEHLPRERVEHPTACVCPSCGGTRLPCIGTDEREVLEYVPSHFKVVVHARPKMSCRNCETITQPPLPSLPIERGLPGPGFLPQGLVASTAIACRCTASPVSMPGAASISSVDACRLGGAYGLSASALDRSDRRACAGRRDAACNDTWCRY